MLDHSILSDQPVLIEVTAPWCHVCRAMQPELDRVATAYLGKVRREVVNASIDGERLASLGVRGTPTLIGQRQGEEVFRHTGWIGPAELDRLVADLSTGRPAKVGKSSDALTRLAAGAFMIALGLVASSWIPLGLGAATAGWGLVGWWRRP